MTTIELELKNGQKKEIEFDGMPTQADIEEIANKLETNTNFEELEQVSQNPVLQGGVEKTINLAPSNILHNITDPIGAGLSAPIKALKDKQTFSDAYNDLRQGLKDEREGNALAKMQDSMIDFLAYGKVNPFKGANVLSVLGNNALQGGLINTVESLKDKGVNLKENAKDLVNGALWGGGLGVGTHLGLKGIAKGIESPVFQDKLAGALEILTSVPKKYTQRAFNKELANESLLQGKFNADETFRKIGDKFTQAKNMLPSKEDFAEQFNRLGKKAYEGFNNKQTKLEQDIRAVLNEMGENPNTLDIQNLRNRVMQTINSFSNGGDINPALETAGREIKDIKRLLGIISPEEKQQALNGILKGANEKMGFYNAFDSEGENIALDLLSQQTGKAKEYLRMILKANNPQQAKQKAFETLMNEIETKPFDNLSIDGSRFYAKYPELFDIMQDSTTNKEFMTKLASRITGRDFKKYNFDNDPLASTIAEADNRFNKIINKFFNDLQKTDYQEYFSTQKDTSEYLQTISKLKNGKLTPKQVVKVITEPSKVWQNVGLPNKNIVISQDVFKKMGNLPNKFEKNHFIGDETLNNLPELIQNPVYILRSRTNPQRFVSVLNAVDSENRPIVTVIQPANGQLKVNIIPSAYGRNNFSDFLNQCLKEGKLLYKNTTTAARGTIPQVSGSVDTIVNDFSQNVNPYEKVFENFSKNLGGLDDSLKEEYMLDLMDVINKVENIENPQVKPIDLHNIKELLYDKANYDIANSGIKNNVLKALASDINDTLRSANSKYAQVNDAFKMLKDVEKAFGGSQGVNPNTIASKLMNYGEKGNILNNMDSRLRSLDAIVDTPNKFFLDTKALKNRMNEQDYMLSLIGSKNYERNPKLLANFNDTAREQALKDLQTKTRADFIEELENARAREVFEKLVPGQGGGSGSAEGYANLFRNALTTSFAGSIGGGWKGSLGGAIIGLLASSPKIAGKGTIKNLGALYRQAELGTPQWLIPLLFGTKENLTK